MALPPLNTLLDLLQDNSSGDISAADMRFIVTELYNGILTSGGGGGGASIPVGGLLVWPDTTLPDGFLDTDGAAVNRTTYADLFGLLGVKYGAGDNVSTFNLPDYRGLFLRVMAAGQTTDPDRATRTNRGDGTIGDNVGTKQADELKSHTHGVGTFDALDGSGSSGYYSANGGPQPSSATGGAETRPKNVNVRVLIRWKAPVVSSFTSTNIAVTAGTKVIAAQAHGLGVAPVKTTAFLRCITNDAATAFVAGDVVETGVIYDGAANGGIQVHADATNIGAVQLGALKVLHKTTSVLTTITYANWALVLQADK